MANKNACYGRMLFQNFYSLEYRLYFSILLHCLQHKYMYIYSLKMQPFSLEFLKIDNGELPKDKIIDCITPILYFNYALYNDFKNNCSAIVNVNRTWGWRCIAETCSVVTTVWNNSKDSDSVTLAITLY
jgi:hypothetical protein